MRTSVTRQIAMLLSVLVLVVSGCTDEQTQPSDLPDLTSSENSPTESAPSADEQAIVSAYKGYFETVQSLGVADEATIRTKLAPFAEGPAIENIVAGMAKFRSLNQQPAGSVVFSELEVTIAGDGATVQECHDGSTELIVDSTTGAVISTGPIRGLQAQVNRKDGTWRVVSYDRAEGVC